MPNPIASILKQARKASGLSVKDTAAHLNNIGIHLSAKTLYGYESGISMPNADVFVALCQLYQYDPSGGVSDAGMPALHAEERSLLDDYRQLDPCGQEFVRTVLGHEKERVRKIREWKEAYSEGENDSGGCG
mgnify:CR=1 FL=1